MSATLRTRLRWLIGTALVGLSCGCETRDLGFDNSPPHRPLSHASPAATGRTPESALARASREVSFELAVAERRLARNLRRPDSLEPQECPDNTLREDNAPPLLHLLTRDSRADQRQLLPLNITRELAPDELQAVRDRFAQPRDHLAARVYRRLNSLEDAVAAKRALSELAARPYAAVVHVIGYAEPRLTRKPNARRRHWVPGILDTLLVIHDLRDNESLCQVRITVRNDTTDAPIRIRLRSDTRERLKHQLGEHWHRKALEKVPQITSYLRWPVPTSAELRGG